MSVFQVLQKWFVKSGSSQEFGHQSFAASTFDTQKVKIVTGDLSGKLCIYQPTTLEYTIDDLKLEKKFHKPILQIEIGKFLQGGRDGICVLFSDEFHVYDVIFNTILSLNQIYSSEFSHGRHAHSFTYGPFGGDSLHDRICFQLMNGHLLFYEQNRQIFTRILNNFILPGPIQYIASCDSIVTVNSEMILQSFSFKSISVTNSHERLSSSSLEEPDDERKEEEDLKLRQRSGLKPEWECNLGQHAIDIQICRFSKNIHQREHEIMVLCERGAFLVSTKGRIRWQNMFEYTPACMRIYFCGNDEGPNLDHMIVCSHQNTLHLYSCERVLWVAMTSIIPIFLHVCAVGDVKNMILCATDSGEISASYLGTEQITKSFADEEREMSFPEMNKQFKELQQEIRMYAKKKKSNEFINLKLQTLVPEESDSFHQSEGTDATHKVRLFVTCCGQDKVQNLHINVNTPNYVQCDRKHIQINKLEPTSTPFVATLTFTLIPNIIPINLDVLIVVSHTVDHHPCYKQVKFQLPLLFVAKPVKPIKRASQQIMLTTQNGEIPDLFDIFEEEIEAMKRSYPESFQRKHMFTFQFREYDSFFTVQTSKKGEPWICLRSESYASLALIIKEIMRKNGHRTDYFLWGSESPESMLLEQVSTYWNILEQCKKANEEIEQSVKQLKAVQKRILIKLQDKIPTPLTHLELLLKDTHENLIEAGENRIEFKNKLLDEENHCHALITIYTYFLAYTYGIDSVNLQAISQFISDCCNQEADQAWGSKTDAHIFYLLRTTFAKSTKDQSKSQPSIEQCDNVNKFKRHIRTLRDRLKQKQNPSNSPQGSPNASLIKPVARNSSKWM